MLIAIICTVALFAIVFPDSAVGRFIAGLFVRRDAKPLSLAKIVAILAAAILVAAFATAFPLDLVVLMDFSAYTELMVALVLVVSQVRLRQLCEGAGNVFRQAWAKAGGLIRIFRNVRPRRTRRSMLPGKGGDSSDTDGADWVLA